MKGWWPNKEQLILVRAENSSASSGPWTSFFNDYAIGNGGHYVLSSVNGGVAAQSVEQLSDEAVLDRCLQVRVWKEQLEIARLWNILLILPEGDCTFVACS